MTICIAAIAKDGGNESVVFATDHMVTTMTGQFEHSMVKYKPLNKSTIAMLSGHALLFDEITEMPQGNLNYQEMKKQIFKNLKNKRDDIIEKEIFSVFGIDRKFFLNALEKEIPNPYVNSILEQVSNFKLNTNILLIGFDEGVAQISEINDKAIIDFRNMNFHAIGSGMVQASNTLLFQKHSKEGSLQETIYNVFKAKRNAEVMDGVGKETELLVLNKEGYFSLTEKELNTLSEIYEEELKYGKCHEKLKNIKKGA